jgi:hypothetical protein
VTPARDAQYRATRKRTEASKREPYTQAHAFYRTRVKIERDRVIETERDRERQRERERETGGGRGRERLGCKKIREPPRSSLLPRPDVHRVRGAAQSLALPPPPPSPSLPSSHPPILPSSLHLSHSLSHSSATLAASRPPPVHLLPEQARAPLVLSLARRSALAPAPSVRPPLARRSLEHHPRASSDRGPGRRPSPPDPRRPRGQQ